nr:MAG TPA: hypothetical protein [Caudoviricetes sp.]
METWACSPFIIFWQIYGRGMQKCRPDMPEREKHFQESSENG